MPTKTTSRRRTTKVRRRKGAGTIYAIGGHENREATGTILKDIARKIGRGKLVVTTVASSQPDGMFDEYASCFKELGVRNLKELVIEQRADAMDPGAVEILEGAKGVFFTGGDQLKVASQIGDTPVFERIQEIFAEGGVLAGTSAGASIMADNMLIAGDAEKSHVIGDNLKMAPGLALLRDLVIDQHFSQRGRLGRLAGAIAQNPLTVGIGLDENTAAIFEGTSGFYVIGAGAVYVLDGQDVAYSNIAEESVGKTMTIYGIRMHILSQGDAFDIENRQPYRLSRQKMRRLPKKEDG